MSICGRDEEIRTGKEAPAVAKREIKTDLWGRDLLRDAGIDLDAQDLTDAERETAEILRDAAALHEDLRNYAT